MPNSINDIFSLVPFDEYNRAKSISCIVCRYFLPNLLQAHIKSSLFKRFSFVFALLSNAHLYLLYRK